MKRMRPQSVKCEACGARGHVRPGLKRAVSGDSLQLRAGAVRLCDRCYQRYMERHRKVVA